MANILFHLLRAVAAERERQDTKFGAQDYPLVEPGHVGDYLDREEGWKRINAQRIANGTRTGDGVLLEEVYEAFNAGSPRETVAELVQVAAVALLLAEMEVRHHPEALPLTEADQGGHAVVPGDASRLPRHPYRGADRLHGICPTCGDGKDGPYHLPVCTCAPLPVYDGPEEDCPVHGRYPLEGGHDDGVTMSMLDLDD